MEFWYSCFSSKCFTEYRIHSFVCECYGLICEKYFFWEKEMRADIFILHTIVCVRRCIISYSSFKHYKKGNICFIILRMTTEASVEHIVCKTGFFIDFSLHSSHEWWIFFGFKCPLWNREMVVSIIHLFLQNEYRSSRITENDSYFLNDSHRFFYWRIHVNVVHDCVFRVRVSLSRTKLVPSREKSFSIWERSPGQYISVEASHGV